MKYLCGHECKRSSVLINMNTTAKATKYSWGMKFTLLSVSMVIIAGLIACISVCRRAQVRGAHPQGTQEMLALACSLTIGKEPDTFKCLGCVMRAIRIQGKMKDSISPPPILVRKLFKGEEGRVDFEAPRSRNFSRPPSSLEEHYRGVGGGAGDGKIGPPNSETP